MLRASFLYRWYFSQLCCDKPQGSYNNHYNCESENDQVLCVLNQQKVIVKVICKPLTDDYLSRETIDTF